MLLSTYFSKVANIGYTYQLYYELNGNIEDKALAKCFYRKALEITRFKRYRNHIPMLTEQIGQLDSGSATECKGIYF